MQILCSIIFARKSYHLLDNVEKYGGPRQAKEVTAQKGCALSTE